MFRKKKRKLKDFSDGDYFIEQQRMVEDHLRRRDIVDRRVLDAMLAVPRHCFVPEDHRHLAYVDGPLPIGCGQTISQPYIVALMTQMLALKGNENVLEVGTGSGYQAAILGYLARQVYTIERHASLAKHAETILQTLGYNNVHVLVGDGSLGWVENAPYQAILVTAAAPKAPQVLLDQLAPDGRLVIPVGGASYQFLERWYRQGDQFDKEELTPVAFVPLRGKWGWRDEGW
ncbi:MAG: protein-L-isoaspartate(D-aspartate) O-methyltransferase [Anaerolineales bacterium]|nr:protein-L-isoaspartate(D-aspartate) O-methyltransferase [Anaerolineales bacterium]